MFCAPAPPSLFTRAKARLISSCPEFLSRSTDVPAKWMWVELLGFMLRLLPVPVTAEASPRIKSVLFKNLVLSLLPTLAGIFKTGLSAFASNTLSETFMSPATSPSGITPLILSRESG